MDTNSVVLIGRLTRDAELKYTQSGTAIMKFSIAQNQRKKTGDTWEDEAHFFDVAMMGKAAESVHRYLVKGKQVAVNGILKQHNWTTAEGDKRYKIEIFCLNVQLLGSKSDGTQGGSQVAETSEEFDDDVPF